MIVFFFSVRFLNTLLNTLSRRRRENVEDSAQSSRAVYLTQTVRGNAGNTYIKEPFLAEGYFFSHDHLTQLLTQPRKTEIKPHAKVQYCGPSRGGIRNITESEQRYVYPLLLPNEITYITYLTRPVTYIMMLDERNDNEYLHLCIAAPERSELARNNFANFVSNGCSLVDYVAHNLESFAVPLMPIRKIHKKKTEIKP